MSVRIIRSDERYRLLGDWLDARWSFSFDRYYDPANLGFGALRVFNDDRIKPASGFPPHPHADMEIVTCLLEGELEHKDNSGGGMVLKPGGVQVMTAGSGIVHSEVNPSETETAHLLQIWIKTNKKGHVPGYDYRQFDEGEKAGSLLAVAGGGKFQAPLCINQDACVYLSSMALEDKLSYEVKGGRGAHLFVIKGRLKLDTRELKGGILEEGDAVRISGAAVALMEAMEDGEINLIDIPLDV